MVLLHLGDGIAAGIVINGAPYRGFTGNAGQVGHNVVTEDGALCYCGNRGCLESVASPRAMIQACHDAAASGVQTRVIDEAGDVESVAFAHIVAATAKGDPFAANLLDQAGRHIGRTAAALINVFEPERLLLSGPLAVAGGEMVATIRRAARLRMLPSLRDTTAIDIGRLGEPAAVLGAAAGVLDDFFSDAGRVMNELLP